MSLATAKEDNEFKYHEHLEESQMEATKDGVANSLSQKMSEFAGQLKLLGKKTKNPPKQDSVTNMMAPHSKDQAAQLREPLTQQDSAHEDAVLAQALETEFFEAVESGNAERLTELLNQGANVNTTRPQDGLSPLQVACSEGQDAVCAVLLLRGALVNAFNPQTGWTALHAAACRGDAAVAKRLLQAGANVNARANDGRTALHFACEAGNQQLVKELLLANSHANACAHDGKTPLHYACIEGDLDCVKRLLAAGAKEVKDMPGREPVELAQQVGHEAIVKLLLKKRKKGTALPESIKTEVERRKSLPTIPLERWFVLNDQGKMLETDREKVALFNSRAAAANWAVKVCEDSFQVAEILAEKWPIFQREVKFEWIQEDDDPLWEEYLRAQKESTAAKDDASIDVYEFTRRQEEQMLKEKISQIQQEIDDIENRKQQALHSQLQIQEESKIISERCSILEENIKRYRLVMHESSCRQKEDLIKIPKDRLKKEEREGSSTRNVSKVKHEETMDAHRAIEQNSVDESLDTSHDDDRTETNLTGLNSTQVPLDQDEECSNSEDRSNASHCSELTDKEVSDITSAVDFLLLESRNIIKIEGQDQRSEKENAGEECLQSNVKETELFHEKTSGLSASEYSELTDEQMSEITSVVDSVLWESRNLIRSKSMDDMHSIPEHSPPVTGDSLYFDEDESTFQARNDGDNFKRGESDAINDQQFTKRDRSSTMHLLQIPLPFGEPFSEEDEDHTNNVQKELQTWLEALHIGKKDAEKYSKSLADDGFDSYDALMLIQDSDLKEKNVKKAHCRIILKHLSLSG